MDKNQGYEIIKAVMLENGRGFALGHNPAAPSPYVTWAYYDDKDGQRQEKSSVRRKIRSSLQARVRCAAMPPLRSPSWLTACTSRWSTL